MKHLKSTARNLRELFNHSISVNYITEPILSYDAESVADQVKEIASKKGYDSVGVRENGVVTGFVDIAKLQGKTLGESRQSFNSDDLIDATSSMVDAIRKIKHKERLFVRSFGHVNGIVTHGDLQKQPVRMWLFSLISMIEMQMLRIIREAHPNDTWSELLKENRLASAKVLHERRLKLNEDIDLADCLQFCDKREIFLKDSEILSQVTSPDESKNENDAFYSKVKVESILKKIEKLRDNLAHAQVLQESWSNILETAEQAGNLLVRLEEIEFPIP